MKPGKYEGLLEVRYIAPRRWRLLADFTFVRPDGSSVIACQGSDTDGASVPRILWRLIAPWDAVFPAAVIHDSLCSGSGVLSLDNGWWAVNPSTDWKEWAKVFRECLDTPFNGIRPPAWKRRAAYLAVIAYGKVTRKPGA